MSKWSKMSKLEKGLTGAFNAATATVAAAVIAAAVANIYGVSNQNESEQFVKNDGRYTITAYKGTPSGLYRECMLRDSFKAIDTLKGKPTDILVCKSEPVFFKKMSIRPEN